MAIVRYHSVGASNTGKVRPASYKYADPTDTTNAHSIPIYVTSGRFDDFFYGTNPDTPKYGDISDVHVQERRDTLMILPDIKRCEDNGFRSIDC